MAATVQDALNSISSVILDGSFKQPIGIGSNLAPWADWIAAGITTAAAPAFLSGDYASLPVGADLFQRFSPLANGTYQLSFWVQNTSSAPAHLVFDVQPVGGGVDISQWFSLGLLWDLTLPANSGWTKEIVTFTVNNPPALLSEFSFSNSYDAPIGQLASTINAAGTVINVAEVSILALGQGTGPAIEDSAANVLANLDTLGTLASAGRLGSISLTDPGTPELTLTGTQLVIGVAMLERIVGPYEVTVVGSLDAPTASSISTTIAAHVGAFAVSDSAASVSAHLDGLQGLLAAGKLTSISLTDGGSPTIVITPSQAATDAPVLQSISSDYRLTISGPVDVATALGLPTSVLAKLSHALTASDVADPATQFFDSENGHIYQFIATPALHWTDAEQAATSYVLGGQHGYLATITSADEQAFVQSHIGSTSALSYWLGGVRDANNNWAWTEGPDAGLQFWHGNADGGSIGGAYSNWDLGAAIPQPNQVGENYLNIDAVSYGYGLNPGKWADANNADNWGSIVEYGGQAAGGLKIADSAANLAAHLDALGALAAGGAIGSITLTDQTVPILPLSPAQLLADAPLLETIAGNFQLSLSGPIPATAIGTLPLQLLQKIISPAPTVADASIHGGFVNAATNTAEQSLSGTSEPGSTVTVYLNGANTPSFTATADSSGVWSHLVGALSDGKYSYTATATNAVGTVSAPSASLAFTVDTQAPGTQGPPLSSLITNPSTQFYDAANGHVYEVVNTAVTWTEALNMSATHTLGGVQGHLVTVTSAAENQFVTNLAANYVTTGWDGRSIWLAGSDAQQEGVWRWMAGPETGAQFWQGDGSGHAIGAFSPPWYANQPSDPNGSSGMSGTWSNPLGTGADYLFLDAYYPGSIWADVYSSTTAVSTPSSPIASSEGVRNAYIIEYEPQAAIALTVSNPAIVNGYVNGIHNTGAQALNGLAEPGSTVSVFLNGATTPAFTATADPTGAWSHTVGVLADGSYSYVATATDAAGNVSLPTAPLAFTVKTLTTESPITDAAVTIGSDGAAYLNAAHYNGGTTTLSGKAEAGDTVTVSDGTHVTTATVASDGSWTAAISGLLNGQSYSYTATATDVAGNTATSAPFAFKVDTQAPGTQAASLSSFITDPATQFYNPVNGHVYEVVNAAVTWTEALNQSATHTLGGVQGHLVTITSAAENQFVTDLVAQHVTTGWNNSAIWLAGSDAQQEGVWRWMAGPEAGTQFWQGNGSGYATGSYTPTWYINQPQDENGSSGNSGAWSNPLGTGSDYLFLYGSIVPGQWDDTYSSTTAISTPSSPIASTDGIRNAYIIEYEPQAAVPLTVANAAIVNGYVNGILNTGAQALNGLAEPGSTVSVFLNGATIPAFTATADPTGAWSHTVGVLADGSYSYVATATDVAGNVSLPTAPLAFTVKTLTTESPITDAAVTIGSDGAAYLNAAHFNGGTTTLSGKAEASDTVTVSDGTHVTSATVANDGTWTAAISGLVNGETYTYTATATDDVGNSATSAPFVFTVKTSTTESAITDAAVVGGFINAAHFNGGVTILSGKAEAGDTVSVSDGAHVTPATVSADGIWTAAISGLLNGQSYSYTATATDAAGNTATSAPFAFTVKTSTTESAITDTAVVGGFINAAHFNGGVTTLSGIAEAGDTVTVSDGTHVTPATVSADGAWTAAISGLFNGQSYSYTATATDAAGNTATSAPFAFTVKTSTFESAITDAAVTGGYLNGAHFNGGSTTLSGKAEAGDTVTVSDGTHATVATVASDGSWTAVISGLGNGQRYSYTATALDAAGNTATSQPFAFTVKTSTSESAITDAAVIGGFINAAHFNAGTTTLSGKAEAGDTVIVSDGTHVTAATVATDGSWTAAISGLLNGQTYSYTATATDLAGNTATSAPFGFKVDTQPPSPTISTAGGEAIYPAVIISGTGEAGTLVQLYDGLTKIGAPVAVSGNGSWTETVTLVGTGSHAISALDTDAAGNTGKSASIVFSLDNQIVGNTNQSIISGTSANDHITVVPNNLIVNAGGGNDTITLTSGPSTQVHIVDGGAGTNTLDLSQISSAVTVDLKLGVASGSQVGTVLLSSIQNVVAGGGAEAIVGSSGANVFQAGSGMDRITGGGGADTFVFRPGFGNTTVTDFKVSGASHGTIEIDHSIFATWAALDAALADSKQGAVITVNAAESITLNGVTKAQLEANHLADFHFI